MPNDSLQIILLTPISQVISCNSLINMLYRGFASCLGFIRGMSQRCSFAISHQVHKSNKNIYLDAIRNSNEQVERLLTAIALHVTLF